MSGHVGKRKIREDFCVKQNFLDNGREKVPFEKFIIAFYLFGEMLPPHFEEMQHCSSSTFLK